MLKTIIFTSLFLLLYSCNSSDNLQKDIEYLQMERRLLLEEIHNLNKEKQHLEVYIKSMKIRLKSDSLLFE
jgi:hypothetical protein